MTTPTPEQLQAMLGVVSGDEPAVIGTIEQPLRHASSAWATELCGEECGDHHLKHKGDFLDAEGWDEEAELAPDGYHVKIYTGILREVAQ